MALVDCPECGRRFSQYAKVCPRCHFPNPLALYPPGGGRALTKRRTQELEPPQDWDTDEEAGRWQPPAASPEYRTPRPEYRPQPEPAPQPQRAGPETITAYEVVKEHHYDNSLSGFFHGKTHFWFGLCIYYLGGVFALTVATAALGHPIVMLFVIGSWAFVGMFFLLWNAKNLPQASGTWFARIVIVLILLCWIGAAIQH